MMLFAGKPYIQYCENCGWEHIVTSDCLMDLNCPECNTKLKLKPLSGRKILKCKYFSLSSFLQKIKDKLGF